MARASTVIGLTMLGAAGVGAASIPFMNSGSASSPQGVAGISCSANRFSTTEACQAAGHPVCRPDGTQFVPANCTTGGSGSSGTRWYNSHPIYWFGGGRGGTTTSPHTSGPQTVTTTRPGSGGTTTTTSPTSSRGGFGSSSTSHGGSSSS